MSATIFWEPVKVNVKQKSLHVLAPSWFISCLERADEREACANMCMAVPRTGAYFARLIRARGTT